VIPITRVKLDDTLAGRLDTRTTQLKTVGADSGIARKAWKSAAKDRYGIRNHLTRMAPGIQRCMYCGDNLGTDIDHFEPISSAPVRAFEWVNHLLACSFCNSNQKRDSYPRDPSGQALLIDPTSDDPSQHLALTLTTGKYRALSNRGQASVDVFGLNREDLARGRRGAFITRSATLCRAYALFGSGHRYEAIQCIAALAEEPHASVLYAMMQSMHLPGAVDVLGADVMAALQEPVFVSLLTPLPKIEGLASPLQQVVPRLCNGSGLGLQL
jgi:uncharacterized protein (TIGR02646 family)